jgi:hypothetical protein
MIVLLAAGTTTLDIQGSAADISHILSVAQLIQIGAGAILAIGSLAVLFFLLLGGLNWITAGGDKSKVEAARGMITQAIIGIAILASVFAVYNIILKVLGITTIREGATSPGVSTSSVSTGGGSGGSGNDTCTPGSKPVSDGGAGGYCNGGAANVVCVNAGVGYSKLPYAHYEPCGCITGKMNTFYHFVDCSGS